MFFVLSKVLSLLFHPVVWLAVILILTWLVQKPIWKRRLRFLYGVFFFLSTSSIVIREAQRLWEDTGVAIEDVDSHEIGIVLGGIAEYNNDLDRLSLRRGGDRIWQAMNLYHSGKINKILISGDNGHLEDQGLHEAVQFKENLILHGIPAEDILTESKSRNTYENAFMTKELLDSLYSERPSCVLVTSGTHMKRSLAIFKKLDFEVTPFSTDHFTGEERNYYAVDWLVPNPACLVEWYRLNHEMFGYIVYKFKGYL
jgi:uncharacterized SAM-binding protein YcdF (DUF218 family)